MYIYDPELSGAQSRLAEQPGCNSYYSDRCISGLGHGRSSGSYVWANEGLGEAPKQSTASEGEVRALRESLNKWRALKGETLITETGPLGSATRRAILEFQVASGLKRKDGLDGPATRERLTLLLAILKNIPSSTAFSAEHLRLIGLVGSSGFGSLDGPTQTEVLKRIDGYLKSGTLVNVKNLTNLVTETGFELLRPSSQTLMLRLLAARPDDDFLAFHLSFLPRATGFRNLGERLQTWVLTRIEGYRGNRTKIGNLVNVITVTNDFDQLSQQTRNLILSSVANHASDVSLTISLRTAADHRDFRQLPQTTQTEIINRILAYPRNFSNVDNLMTLVTTPGFDNLGLEVRADVLDHISSRFPDVLINPAGVGNLMNLLTASGFEKLRADVRNFMLDVQAQRVNNPQLANALRDLAADPKFRNDHRMATQTILKVNDSIP